MIPIITTNETMHENMVGSNVTLECEVEDLGTKVARIVKWKKKSEILVMGGNFIKNDDRIRLDGNNILIYHIDETDAGEYTCEVSSAGGNDRRSASLDVIELPYAPAKVHAEKVSTAHKTVNVSWTPGFNGNSPVIKYILQYRTVSQEGIIPKDDLNWITALTNISASNRHILLSHLRYE